MEEAGIRGGALIPHPYRTTEEADRLYGEARAAGEVEEGTGKWEYLRELSDGWDDMSRYIEESPHYHALVPERYVDGEAAPDGWIVKNLNSGEGEPFDLNERRHYEEMIAPVFYTLTHAGVQKGRASVTYFGGVHPAAFSPEDALEPAVWETIQSKVARLLGVEESDGVHLLEPSEDSCPRDDCEAPTVPIGRLREWLDDDDWVHRIRMKKDGRKRLAQLRGASMMLHGFIDRPPPGRERLLRRLREKGDPLRDTPSQTGLQDAIQQGV